MAIVEAAPVVVDQDVVYARAGGRDLLCDVYRPPAEVSKHTAIVQFPGGGFRRANKAGTRLARPLAALGYTTVAAEYRVVPDLWPAPLDDALAAIRWTRSHAGDLGVEAKNVVVLGYSAGGRLALLCAATRTGETGVAACVAFYPSSGDLSRHPVVGEVPSAELLTSIDVLGKIRSGYPPTLLLHGTADTMIPVNQTLELYSALRTANVPAELHVVEGVTHIFDAHPDMARASAEWIDLFLDRHVVSPRVYPSTEPPRP
jgi:acetyl esterase/lipase